MYSTLVTLNNTNMSVKEAFKDFIKVFKIVFLLDIISLLQFLFISSPKSKKCEIIRYVEIIFINIKLRAFLPIQLKNRKKMLIFQK